MGRMVEYIEKFYMDDTGKIYHEGRTGEVIRCKDCKNSEPWYGDRRRCLLWTESGVSVWDVGFCNYAERKEE